MSNTIDKERTVNDALNFQNKRGFNALMLASVKGHASIVQELVRVSNENSLFQLLPNLRESRLNTALMLAASKVLIYHIALEKNHHLSTVELIHMFRATWRW